jgi:hypothetical protein
MKNICLLISILACFMLSSCMMSYMYNNQTYSSKSDAYAAQTLHRNEIAKALNDPLPNPVTDKKLIIGIPTKATYTKTITWTGNHTPEAKKNLEDYITTVADSDFMSMANLVKNKNIYKTVEIIRTSGEHILMAQEGVDVLYLYVESPQAVGWYQTSLEKGRKAMTPDTGIGDMSERLRQWLHAISIFAMEK